MLNNKNIQKGFTLIELLVVISIISLLSTIVLSSIDSARENAQWSKFDRDVQEIRNAFQLYREDNGSWPVDYGSSLWLADSLSLLTSSSYYNASSLDSPMGNNFYLFVGKKIEHPDGYYYCGSYSSSDTYYYLAACTDMTESYEDFTTKSSLGFKSATYDYGSGTVPIPCVCVDLIK